MTDAPLPGSQTARTPSVTAWGIAAIVALAFHGSVALALIWRHASDEADDDVGAPAIELAMDMAAPKVEQSETPPGPDSAASSVAPDSAEAKPETKTTDLPKDEPVETDNPDRVVSPQEQKQQEEEAEAPKKAPSQASTASVAAEDTAAPAQEATRPAPVARAPVIGPGRAALRQRAAWQRRLVAHLDRHKRYPAAGGAHEARVEVNFTIDRLGHIQAASVVKSSGLPAFDSAALAMVRRSDPVPPPPALVADEGLTFTMPVLFRSRD